MLDELGNEPRLEHFKRVNITKPQGFVGGHRIDNRLTQTATRLRLNTLDQFAEVGNAFLFQQAVQAAGDQILLVVALHNAAGLFLKVPKQLKVLIRQSHEVCLVVVEFKLSRFTSTTFS